MKKLCFFTKLWKFYLRPSKLLVYWLHLKKFSPTVFPYLQTMCQCFHMLLKNPGVLDFLRSFLWLLGKYSKFRIFFLGRKWVFLPSYRWYRVQLIWPDWLPSKVSFAAGSSCSINFFTSDTIVSYTRFSSERIFVTSSVFSGDTIMSADWLMLGYFQNWISGWKS